MTVTKKYESMWECDLRQINFVKHFIVLDPSNEPPIHSAPDRVGPKQRELEIEEIEKMREAGVAEPSVRE